MTKREFILKLKKRKSDTVSVVGKMNKFKCKLRVDGETLTRIFDEIIKDAEQMIASSDRSADRQLLIDYGNWRSTGDGVFLSEDERENADKFLKSINNVGEQGD